MFGWEMFVSLTIAIHFVKFVAFFLLKLVL